MITKQNPQNFRHVLLCSVLSEQSLVLQQINQKRSPPGLKPQESNFLNLIQLISTGSKVVVTKGSTHLNFSPGVITNNDSIELEFDCGVHRCIGYFLEYLFLFAMFGKNALNIRLKGITDNGHDSSVDTIQQHLIPLLKEHYGFDNELSMQIVKRGYEPQGGGQVKVVVPTIRKLNRVNLEERGYIKRIRGVCSGSKVSTSILNQVKDQAKSVFLEFIPDVWIYTDYYKGDKASRSPGYTLSLKAQTTTGSIITYDSVPGGDRTEDFVQKATKAFLDEIQHCGVISTNYQWFLLTLMAFSERKTSSAKIGRVSGFTIQCLRIMRDFFGITFEIQQAKGSGLALFRCLGLGYQNYARIMK